MTQQNTDEKSLWLSLKKIPALGSAGIIQLLQKFGEPEHIYAASYSDLKSVTHENIASQIRSGPDLDAVRADLDWLAQDNNHLITLADEIYPKALLEISDPPAMLYAKGDLSTLNLPSIGIVGSRNASTQGERNAENFAQALAESGLCIVSGMALGIDGAAHRGALKANQGRTIAVVGTGLDIVYPSKHRDLAHQIASQGLMLSEFSISSPSRPENFLQRDRIISGLSLGCLVVEANIHSGSLVTAKFATEQGREVFAIPGSIHSPVSKGCHLLIKQGAKLVDTTQDITDELAPHLS